MGPILDHWETVTELLTALPCMTVLHQVCQVIYKQLLAKLRTAAPNSPTTPTTVLSHANANPIHNHNLS